MSGTAASLPGIPWASAAGQLSRQALTSGEETLPRLLATAVSVALLNQRLTLAYFRPRTALLSANVRLVGGGTAAGPTPTLVRAGLYSVAANGDGTLVASIANDTTLFSVSGTRYTRAWSAPVQLSAGAFYALGLLCVTAAAAPTVPGLIFDGDAGGARAEMMLDPILCGQLLAQADLPANFTQATLTSTGSMYYAAILP